MEFHAFNQAYLSQLYERYLERSDAVSPAVRSFFDSHPATFNQDGLTEAVDVGDVVAAVHLAHAVRQRGYLAAKLDPLGRAPVGDPAVDPRTHHLDRASLGRLPAAVVVGPVAMRASDAWDAIEKLQSVYTTTRG